MRWEQPFATDCGTWPEFHTTFCGKLIKVLVFKTGEYSAKFGDRLYEVKAPEDALTWLRAQCIAALRADVERAGHLMVTREQVTELQEAAYERGDFHGEEETRRLHAIQRQIGMAEWPKRKQ